MKRRSLLLLLIAVFLIGSFWWFVIPALYVVPQEGVYRGLQDSRWKWWNRMKRWDRAFEWKMPINFYGRVVDQNQNPVPGAAVRFVWTNISSEGTSTDRAISDSMGRFSLLNRKGKALSVYVSKESYHTSGGKGGKSFEYAAFFESNYHRPDPQGPVNFLLVKKLDAEPLIAQQVSPRASYDQPSYYDLEHGSFTQQPSAGGGLKFTMKRTESPQGQPFDWKWELEAVNGGLVETRDEFAQVAPEEGYTPNWERSQTASATDFRKSSKARFFLRTGDHRFARIDVELVHPNSRAIGPRFTISSFLNPSGSRSLEYDASKRVLAR